jgi:hypothetical protein
MIVRLRGLDDGLHGQADVIGSAMDSSRHAFSGALDTPKGFFDALVYLTSPGREHLGRPIHD